MADEELEALRKQRLAELQAKHGVSERAGGVTPSPQARLSAFARGPSAPVNPMAPCVRSRGWGAPGGRHSLLGSRRVPRETCAGWGVRALESPLKARFSAAVEPQASPAGIGVSSDWVFLTGSHRCVEGDPLSSGAEDTALTARPWAGVKRRTPEMVLNPSRREGVAGCCKLALGQTLVVVGDLSTSILRASPGSLFPDSLLTGKNRAP